MYKITLCSILFVSLLLLTSCQTEAHKPEPVQTSLPREELKVPLGVWSWGRFYRDADDRKANLDFCVKHDIRHIDQWVSYDRRTLEIAYKDDLKKLIVEAHQHGITVNLLFGTATLFFERNHDSTLKRLQKVIDLSKELDSPALRGMKYDVEPYGGKEWRAGSPELRQRIMKEYLDFLLKARKLLHESDSNLELCVDVSAFWDKPEKPFTYHGVSKPLVHHIQDMTDYIGIMSYRAHARGVINLCTSEIAYAAKMQRNSSVCPSVETLNIQGGEHHITFWNRPVVEYHKAMEQLQKKYTGNPAIRYIMVHHLGSLQQYLKLPEGNSQKVLICTKTMRKTTNKTAFLQAQKQCLSRKSDAYYLARWDFMRQCRYEKDSSPEEAARKFLQQCRELKVLKKNKGNQFLTAATALGQILTAARHESVNN